MSTGAKFDVNMSPEVAVSKAQLLSLAMNPDYPEQFVRWLNNKLKDDLSGTKMELVFNNEYRLETIKALQKIQIPKLLKLIGSTPNVTSTESSTVKKLYQQSKFRNLVTVPEGSKELTSLEQTVERIREIQNELQYGAIETTRYLELLDIVEKLLQQFRQLDDMDVEHTTRLKQIQKTTLDATLIRNADGREARWLVQEGLGAIRDWLLSHNNDVLEFDAFHGVYRQRYLASWRSVVEQLTMPHPNDKEPTTATRELVTKLQNLVANLNVDTEVALVDKLVLFSILQQTRGLLSQLREQTPLLMTEYFIDAHRFAVIKIADFASQLASTALSQDLKDIKVAISQTLDLIALLCEHAYRRKRLFVIAANTIHKGEVKGKNFHLLSPDDRNKHVTDLIKQIKRRESLLAIQKQSLLESPIVENQAQHNVTPSMDAVKALFGLTADDLAPPPDTIDHGAEYGGQALETIVSDVMLRYISRFFVVSVQDRLFYIDFTLEADEFSDLVSGLTSLKIDPSETKLLTDGFRQQEDNRLRFLRGLENHYKMLAKRRQADTVKLDLTKFIYQKFLLPFEQASVSAGQLKPFRQGSMKMSDDAACIICLLPDHENSYVDCTPYLQRLAKPTDQVISKVTQTESSKAQDVAKTLNPKRNLYQDIQNAVNIILQNKDYAAFMENFPDIDVQPRLLILQCMQSAVQFFRLIQQTLLLIFSENSSRKVQAGTLVEMDRLRQTVHFSLPGWYNDDLANQYVYDVLFDEKFVRRKGPAELMLDILTDWQDYVPFVTAGVAINAQTGGGTNRDARYATSIVLAFLQARDAYLDHHRSYIEQVFHYLRSSKWDTPADRLLLNAVTTLANNEDIVKALFSTKRPLMMLPATAVLAQISMEVIKPALLKAATNGMIDSNALAKLLSTLPTNIAEVLHIKDTDSKLSTALGNKPLLQNSWLIKQASQEMRISIVRT